MGTTVRYGAFGHGTVEVDDNGFIEMPVVVQESGLFAGAPPAEMRIHTVCQYGADEFNRRYVAKMNRRTDLPFYLTTAKVKITGQLEKITDDMIEAEGLEPIPDCD